jgi:hypothetical protein
MSTYRAASKSKITLVHIPTTGPERLITYENPVMRSDFMRDKFAIIYSHPIAEHRIRQYVETLRQPAHWRLEVGICAARLPWDPPAPVDLPEHERLEGVFGDAHVSFFVSNRMTRDTIQVPIAESEVEGLMDQIGHLWMVKYRPVAAEYRRAIEVVYNELFSKYPKDVRAAAAAAIRDEEERLWEAANILMPIRGSNPLIFTPASTEDADDALPHIIALLRKMAHDDETARAAATAELLAGNDRPTRSQRKKARMRAKAHGHRAPLPADIQVVSAEPALALTEPPAMPANHPAEQPAEQSVEQPSQPLVDQPRVDRLTSDCCIVCEDGMTDMVLLPCRHLCACHACASAFIHCPVCRVAVQQTMRVFIC